MGDMNRKRHEHVGLVARVPEHHSLIARTLLVEDVFARGAGTNFFRIVNALSDVGRLCVEADHDANGFAVVAVGLAVVADALDGVAHDAGNVDISGGRDFARNDRKTRGNEGFACDTTHGVVRQHCVEDGIRDLIGHLVWVALGH